MLAAERQKQILIVDRDVATVEPLRQQLSNSGFVVSAITDGSAAVKALAELANAAKELPVVVDGRLWGLATAGSTAERPLPRSRASRATPARRRAFRRR